MEENNRIPAFGNDQNKELEVLDFSNFTGQLKHDIFYACPNLKKVILPDNLEELPPLLFAKCKNLEEVILPKNLKKIGKNAFQSCKKLSKLNLPSSVQTIPENCFNGCHSLISLNLENILQVEESAFENCYRFRSFPENAIFLGKKAFKNCQAFTHIKLNKKINFLEEQLFCNCKNLKTLSGHEVALGKSVFKNCVSLMDVPDCVIKLGPYCFQDCHSIPSVNYTFDNIPTGAFMGCRNLKEFIFSDNITTLESDIFKNCIHLKRVHFPQRLQYIRNNAFENCYVLESPKFPNNLTKIGKRSFKDCHSITTLYLPTQFESFGSRAFSNLYSLEKIEVSPKNYRYSTHQNEVLINTICQSITLFAMGQKEKEYSLRNFCIQEIDHSECIVPLERIDPYAFEGALKLESIELPTSLSDYDYTSFENCPNLKRLKIFHLSFSSSFYPKITDNGRPYFSLNQTCVFPFKEIEFGNHIQLIQSLSSKEMFGNIQKIKLPSQTSFSIVTSPFKNSNHLKEVWIPANMTFMQPNTFSEETILNFQDRFKIPQALILQITTENKEKIYELRDGTYYLEKDKKFRTISKQEIKEKYKDSEQLLKLPQKILNYQAMLKTTEVKKYNLPKEDILKNGYLVKSLSEEQLQDLLEHYDDITKKVLEKSRLLETPEEFASSVILKEPEKLLTYISLIKKYELQDNSELNTLLIAGVNEINIEPLLKNYNTHLKRLIKESKISKTQDNCITNLIDLWKIGTALGMLESDPKTSQRACTFLIDNLFSPTKNGEKNPFQIVNDDIHRTFDTMNEGKYDEEFASFFTKYYEELMQVEKERSGYIANIYNEFPEISKTSTSNKGLQRHLQVTPEKCLNYFVNRTFNNVTEENYPIAHLISNWFSDQESFDIALEILEEVKEAPRNIFTKNIQTENSWIFDDNKENDLKERKTEGYTYEWLPKNDPQNLVLGKYCSCCAHLYGAGAGIMRASMVDPNCQNLVIKNAQEEIIGKAIIYVNREKQYAVFNNLESNMRDRSEETLNEIYKTFLRGTEAFYETYNQNNPKAPLQKVSIGTGMNTILPQLEQAEYETLIKDCLTPIDYSSYQIHSRGTCAGNAYSAQKLLIPKKS